MFKMLQHPSLSYEVSAEIFGLLKKLVSDAIELNRERHDVRSQIVRADAGREDALMQEEVDESV